MNSIERGAEIQTWSKWFKHTAESTATDRLFTEFNRAGLCAVQNPEYHSPIVFFFLKKGVICDETAFLSPLLKIWGRAECFSRPCRLEWLGGCESEASHAGVTRYLNSFFTFHSVRRRKKEAQKHILRRQLNILNTFICLFWHVWNVPERSHLSHTKAGMNGF